MTRIIKSLGLNYPDYVVSSGGKWNFADCVAEIPDTHNMMLYYPEKTTVMLASSLANDIPIRHVIRGHKATLEFTREGFTITPQESTNAATIGNTGEIAGGNELFTHEKLLRILEESLVSGFVSLFPSFGIRFELAQDVRDFPHYLQPGCTIPVKDSFGKACIYRPGFI